MEKSAKKEMIIYIIILILLVIIVVIKNCVFTKKVDKIQENKVNTVNQTNQEYLTVNNTTYNTRYEEEWMGEV